MSWRLRATVLGCLVVLLASATLTAISESDVVAEGIGFALGWVAVATLLGLAVAFAWAKLRGTKLDLAVLSVVAAGFSVVLAAGVIRPDDEDEPTESFQRLTAQAPECEAKQPEPFRDPGRNLTLEPPDGPRALQAQALELAFAGQGAELDAWQAVQGGHGVIGLVFASAGGANEPLSDFVRGFSEQGGEARVTEIAGHPVALGVMDGGGAAATSSGCYSAFVFGSDEGTIRFILKRLVIGIGRE